MKVLTSTGSQSKHESEFKVMVKATIPNDMHATAVKGTTFAIELVSTVQQFELLKEEWADLCESTNVTVFQSFEWLRTWWKHYAEDGDSAKLYILLVRDPERLIAIAPLYTDVVRRVGIIRVRTLKSIGTGITDYLDFIIRKDFEEICVSLFAEQIARDQSRIDVIHLADFPGHSHNHGLLYNELQRQGYHGTHYVNEICPRLSLRSSWEETLASFPSSKQKRFRQVQKKITSEFKVELRRATDRTRLSDDFTEFFNLHQRRWNDSGHAGVFADERAVKFHREIAQLFFDKQWLFLAFLLLDGERVAANYAFLYRTELFHYLSGITMRENLLKYSIGRILQIYSIAEAAHNGATVYDFMRGSEEYKYYFNSVDANNWTVLMFSDRSSLAETRYKGVLLMDSLSRRIIRERLLWRQSLSGKGLLSREAIDYMRKRIQTNIADATAKLRSPQKSLALHERSKEQLEQGEAHS